ncbi:MAG TPA: hypothetical protein VIG46_03410 [Candidatus Baltobacteraceae bacterium]
MRTAAEVLVPALAFALTSRAAALGDTSTLPVTSMGPGVTRCAISSDGQFVASVSTGVPAVRFKATDEHGKWYGDLIVFPSATGTFTDEPPREYGALDLGAPSTLACSALTIADIQVSPLSATIDVGQNVELRSLFLSRSAATVRLRLFFTDFLGGRTDEPLQDAAYFYRIDKERPIEQIVNGGPSEYLVVRFSNLKPGKHVFSFGPSLDPGEDDPRMTSSVSFTLPKL